LDWQKVSALSISHGYEDAAVANRFSDIGVDIGRRIQLGIQGYFDFDVAGWLLGTDAVIAYDIIGAAAIWQLLRQKFQ
jgi:uncharacterized membrane protein YuzA (DUF378 family)